MGGWVGSRAVLEAVVKRKIPSHSGNRTIEAAIPTELSRLFSVLLTVL
jgi:hypothetical protein